MSSNHIISPNGIDPDIVSVSRHGAFMWVVLNSVGVLSHIIRFPTEDRLAEMVWIE